MPEFWTKGAENYKKTLREQYNAQREQLQDQLKHCTDPEERRALTEEIETLKKDFQDRLRTIGRSLF
jgi:hypothetical protein